MHTHAKISNRKSPARSLTQMGLKIHLLTSPRIEKEDDNCEGDDLTLPYPLTP